MKKNKGFTIIETVVVVVIASIVLLIVGAMLIGQWQLYRTESMAYEVRAQNILAQNIITRNIEESINVVASSTINSEDYSSDLDTIVLRLPSIDANQDIVPGIFDYVAFERDSTDPTKLISDIEKDPASARTSGKKTIAQFVSSLNFGYNDDEWNNVGGVEVTIITQKEVGDVVRESKSFKAVKLKNK